MSAEEASELAQIEVLENKLDGVSLSSVQAADDAAFSRETCRIECLQKLAKCGCSQAVRLAAVDSLRRLCASSADSAAAIASSGSIPVLMELFESSASGAELQQAARAALASLKGCIHVLVQYLGSSRAGLQRAATRTLCDLCATSTDFAHAVAEAPDAVSALVQLLGSSEGAVADEAAAAVATLAHFGPQSVSDEAADAGAITGLVQLLGSVSLAGRRAAALALEALAQASLTTAEAIASTAAIPMLAHTYGGRGPGAGTDDLGAHMRAQTAADRALRSLAECISPALLDQLSSESAEGQLSAAAMLGQLADASPTASYAVARAGSITILVHLLCSSTHPAVQHNAAVALACLAAAKPPGVALPGTPAAFGDHFLGRTLSPYAPEIIAAGAIPRLVQLLGSGSRDGSASTVTATGSTGFNGSHGSTDVQYAAAAALLSLTSGSPSSLAAVAAETDGIPALVRLVGSPCISAAAKCAAIGALQNLACNSSQTASEVVDAGSIPSLVLLLRGSNDGSDVQLAAAGALGLLARSSLPSAAVIAQRMCGRLSGGASTADMLGVIPALVELLWAGGDAEQEVAAEALGTLAGSSHSTAAAIASAGGIPAVYEIYRSNRRVAVHYAANRALEGLAASGPSVAVGVAAMSGVASLTWLLQKGSSWAEQRAAGSQLNNRAVGSPVAAREMAKALSGIRYIVSCLPSASNAGIVRTWAFERTAAVVLASLSQDNSGPLSAALAVVEGGGIPALVQLLSSRSTEAQQAAAEALCSLAFKVPSSVPAILDAGGIAALEELSSRSLGAQHPMRRPRNQDVQNAAAAALQALKESGPSQHSGSLGYGGDLDDSSQQASSTRLSEEELQEWHELLGVSGHEFNIQI